SAWETLSATVSPFTGSTQINQRLQLIALGGAAEFYVDNVSILETNPDISAITQERGIIGTQVAETKTFTFVPHQGFTRQMTVGDLTQIHRFDRGIYAGTTDPGGNSQDQNPGS